MKENKIYESYTTLSELFKKDLNTENSVTKSIYLDSIVTRLTLDHYVD